MAGQLVVIEGADKLINGADVVNEPESHRSTPPLKTAGRLIDSVHSS